MMRSRSLALGQVAMLLVVSAGCASKSQPTLPAMPESVRTGLGVVAVRPSPLPPHSTFASPVPSRAGAAVVGAGTGLGIGVTSALLCAGGVGLAWDGLVGWQGLDWLTACAAAIATPVWFVTGGVTGAVKGVPISERSRSASALEEAAAEPDLPQRFAEQVSAAGSRRRPLLPADERVDTVVEVRLVRLDLERRTTAGKGGGFDSIFTDVLNAPLELVVEARAMVLRAEDGMLLYETASTHRRGSATFTEWGSESAAQFRRDRDSLLEAAAEEIAFRIFGLAPVPPEPEPPAAEEPPG